MRKLKTTFIIGLLLAFLFQTKVVLSQQELMSYTIDNAPYGRNLQPAKGFENSWNLAIANTYFSASMDGPTLDGIGEVDNDGILQINVDDIINSLADENTLNINSYIQTLNVGFKLKGFDIDLGHSLRQQSNFTFNKELIQLFTQGNADFIGKEVSLGMKASLTSFHQFNLGVSSAIGKLRYGVNFKLLNGIYSVFTENHQLNLTTSDGVYQLEMDADYVINSTGLLSIDDTLKVSTQFGDLRNFDFYGANWGMGIDLGVEYQINEKLKVSASLLDLGYINWTDNTEKYTIKDKFSFGGLKLEDLINNEENTTSIRDTLKNIVKVEKSTGDYKTKLTSSFYLSLAYQMSDKVRLSGIYFRQGNDYFTSNTIGLGGHIQLLNWMGLGSMYSLKDGSSHRVGLSTDFKFGPVRIIFATDNFLGVLIPDSSRQLDFRLGTALVF